MKQKLFILLVLIVSQVSFVYSRGAAGDIHDFFVNQVDKFLAFELKQDAVQAKESVVFAGYWLEPLYTGTDIKEMDSYSTIIQTTLNQINESNGLNSVLLHPNIDNNQGYYAQLEELFVKNAENKKLKIDENILLPDFFMLANSYLAQYYTRGFLEELYSDDLLEFKIDVTNWHEGIRSLGEIKDRVYGVPLGHDILVWYVNLELFKQAGLIDENGDPILPTNSEELYEHAKLMKEKTGKHYLGADFLGLNGTRALLTLMWQNNVNVVNEDRIVDFDNLDTRKVTENFFRLFKEDLAVAAKGNIKLQLDFTREEIGVFINTFSYRYNIEEILARDYDNRTAKLQEEAEELSKSFDLEDQKKEVIIPPPGPEVSAHGFPVIYKNNIVWGNTNLIVVKQGLREDDPERYASVLEIIKKIDDNDLYLADHGLLPLHYTTINRLLDKDNAGYYAQASKLNQLVFIRRDIDNEYYYSVELQDLPQIDKYTEVMKLLNNMSNDILSDRITVKHAISRVEGQLVDLLEKDGSSFIR